MKLLWCAVFLLFNSIAVSAQEPGLFNDRIAKAFDAVRAYNTKNAVFLAGANSQFEVADGFISFSDEMPLQKPVESPRDPEGKQQTFSVRTIFLRRSPTIEKRVHVRQGPEDMARMRFIYRPPGQKQNMPQYTFQGDAQAWQIYEGSKDVFFYTQEVSSEGEVQLKEWIYAEAPNQRKGSSYDWDVHLEEFNRFSELQVDQDGSIAIQRHVMVGGVDPKDKKEQKRVVGVVREAMKNIPIYIHGEDVVGRIQPVRYWTREGIAKQGVMRVKNATRLTVMVREPASAYPLVIDPAVIIRQR